MTRLPGQGVDVPLPPDLVVTLGYRYDARFVSFRWAYDDLVFDDGRSSGSANGWVFQTYARHRAVAPFLAPHDLGGSDRNAPLALLIDCEQNRAAVALVAEARAFLHTQWPPEPPLTAEQEEVFRREVERQLAEWRTRAVDPAAVACEMAEQCERVGRLMSWLDMCPAPEAERGP